MLLRFVLFSLLVVLPADGPGDGRRGNALYNEGKYAEAAEAYRQGLASLGDAPAAARYGLLNNLGSALYRMGQFGEARKTFQEAALAAASDADRSRAHYNAGNAAFGEQSLEDALAQYRDALLANSQNDDARFNYEFVKRKLDEQQKQQQQQGNGQNQDQQQQDQNSQNSSGEQNEPQDQNEGQDQQQQQPSENEQDQQQPQDGQEDQQPGQEQPTDPNDLSREQAERILQALQGDEEQLLREVQRQKTRTRDVEKDW